MYMKNLKKFSDPGLFHRLVVASNDLQLYGYKPRRTRKMYFRGHSPIEDRLAQLLDEMGQTYKMNQYIGKYEVDFLLEDLMLVIEANGKYYHNQQKDSIKSNYLHDMGYHVIQVWGTDIMNRPDKVCRKIKLKIKKIRANVCT